MAGQLVTVFGLTYAVSSPVLSALTAGIGRRKLLLASMTAFALANFVASTTFRFGNYWPRAFCSRRRTSVFQRERAGGAVVNPERRGTALAIVNGGTSIAVALGVPLGAIVGYGFGWRMNFAGVGLMAAIAVAGLLSEFRAASTKDYRRRAFAGASPSCDRCRS